MPLRSLVVGCCIVAMLACSTEPGPDSLSLTTDASSYAAGARFTVSLSNSGQPLSYNLCEFTVEHYDGTTWTEAAPQNEPCPGLLKILADGKSDSEAFTLPTTLAPGQYRLRYTFFRGGMTVVAATDPFTITAP